MAKNSNIDKPFKYLDGVELVYVPGGVTTTSSYTLSNGTWNIGDVPTVTWLMKYITNNSTILDDIFRFASEPGVSDSLTHMIESINHWNEEIHRYWIEELLYSISLSFAREAFNTTVGDERAKYKASDAAKNAFDKCFKRGGK